MIDKKYKNTINLVIAMITGWLMYYFGSQGHSGIDLTNYLLTFILIYLIAIFNSLKND